MTREQCLANWPEAEPGQYDPRCCRFPKSCSIPPAQVRAEYVAGQGDGDHAHRYSGQTLRHTHPHDGPHGYFQHPEDPAPRSRYFVAPDGGNDLTLWRDVPDHPERPVPVLRRCDVSEEAFNIAAQLATNEQPAAQTAGDLVRAEATIARVRALFATGEEFDGGGYEPCGPNPTDCDHAECDTARAVLEALDGAP